MTTDHNRPSTVVSATATSTMRLRPTRLLMTHRVRTEQATLEHALTEVRRCCEELRIRLKRLGATDVMMSEPHSDVHVETDPVVRAQSAARQQLRKVRGQKPATGRRPSVNVTVTATWEIANRTTEEVLLLQDRLRFDTDIDTPPQSPNEDETRPPWDVDPAEKIQQMMANMMEAAESGEQNSSPQFLYITLPRDEDRTKATAEAFHKVRQRAEQLAKASGLRLGHLTSISYGHAGVERHDRLMSRQRCLAMLAGAGYGLAAEEEVSEDPRSTEVVTSVNATFALE